MHLKVFYLKSGDLPFFFFQSQTEVKEMALNENIWGVEGRGIHFLERSLWASPLQKGNHSPHVVSDFSVASLSEELNFPLNLNSLK